MAISTMNPELKASLLVRWEPIRRNELHYLVTWSTRGRKPVLRDKHVRAIEAQLRTVCNERNIPLLEIRAGADHVHVLLALKTTQSVTSVTRELKGRAGM